jgi:hypothetical protein
MSIRRTGPLLALLFLVAGCATNPPVVEFTLARTAMQSAQEADAPRYAPSLWHEAEEAYRRGEESYRREDFSTAAAYFEKSRRFSERSENSAKLQKQKSGEDAP